MSNQQGATMEDERKTKKQLLQELTELRSQNATLEKSSFVDQSTDFTSADTLRYAESILETLRDPILVLDNELKIISANRSFHTTFQTTPEQTIGSFIYDLKDRQWDIPKLKELLEEIIPEEKTFDDFEITHEFQYIGHKVMLLNAREIYRKDMGTKAILLAFKDITEHKRLEGLLTDSEERYRRLFETANDGIVLLEKIHGKITHANPAITELLGCHLDDLIGKRLIHIGFPENIGNIQAILQTLEKDGILHYKDAQIRTKTQKAIDTDIYMVDKTSLVQCNIRDITERKQTEEELRKSEYQFRQLFERAPIGIFIVTAEHTIVETNKIALSILGYSREEILQMNAWDIMHPDDLRADPPQSNLRMFFSDEIVDRESRFRTRQGGYIQALINMAKVPSYSEEASHMVMFQDISERKQAEERIYNLGYYDELTALPNWRLFNDRLKQVISVSEHFGDGGVVYLVDVTRLREVNDTLGQQAGDELILEVARRIDDTVGEQVTVARVSGGEFMILSEGRSDSDRAHQLGLRILERIGQSLELPGRLVYPDVNIGYTLFPQRATDPETLIKQADLALSEAKKSALSIQEFTGQEDWISRLFHLEHDLKQALVNEEFFLCYQTQIDLQSGSHCGRGSSAPLGASRKGNHLPWGIYSGTGANRDDRVCGRMGHSHSLQTARILAGEWCLGENLCKPVSSGAWQ